MSTDAAPDCGTYEVTIAGSIGPALRAAFADQSATTVESTTLYVRGSHESTPGDVVDLVGRFEVAGISVQSVRRLAGP